MVSAPRNFQASRGGSLRRRLQSAVHAHALSSSWLRGPAICGPACVPCCAGCFQKEPSGERSDLGVHVGTSEVPGVELSPPHLSLPGSQDPVGTSLRQELWKLGKKEHQSCRAPGTAGPGDRQVGRRSREVSLPEGLRKPERCSLSGERCNPVLN